MPSWTSGVPVPNPSNAWTDPVVTANYTIVKKSHIDELRAFLVGMNGHYHIVDGAATTSNPSLSVSWTDPTLTTTTKVRDIHWNELRNATSQIDNHKHVAKGLWSSTVSLAPYTTWVNYGAITANTSLIRKGHLSSLRSAMDLLHSHNHIVCCECECTCTCECQCQCTCTEECCNKCHSMD